MSKRPCEGVTASGKPCFFSAHPDCAPYCKTHFRARPTSTGAAGTNNAYRRSVEAARAEWGVLPTAAERAAARVTKQEELFKAAAAEMAAASVRPAFSSNVLRALTALGIDPLKNASITAANVRRAYLDRVRESGVREAITSLNKNTAERARVRFEEIQKAYELLRRSLVLVD